MLSPAIDELGRVVDRLDNLIAALSLPMPAAIHLAALKSAIPEIRAVVHRAYVEVAGEDPWDHSG